MTLWDIRVYGRDMARWDPEAESRLRRAALELFATYGYDSVTVTQIAESAGLTRRTFFRYFPDKKEVLFAGSDTLSTALRDRFERADTTMPPVDVVMNTLAEVGEFILHTADDQTRRRSIIAESDELRERERTKLACVAHAVAEYLVTCRYDAHDAHLLGDVSAALFRSAYDRCLDSPGVEHFETAIEDASSALTVLMKAPSPRP